ncbi:hypothetical protein LCGC14_0960220 [marine sediment metagenome]|uniref:Fibronectin type-III domain-containing protein n=1 Tax=marine sediment metagenome TaxID=412755 RepID=A0A0F9QXY2_9ZZZZ
MALIHHYNTGDADTASNIYDYGARDSIRAQVFTSPFTFNLESIKIYCQRNASATAGTITAYITAVDGNGAPTGGSLKNGSVDLMTIAATSGVWANSEWLEITLSSSLALDINIQYALVLHCDGVNPINALYWVRDVGGGYAGGKAYSNDTSDPPVGDFAWNDINNGNDDFLFELWGTLSVSAKATTPIPSDSATGITLDQTTLAWTTGGSTDTYNVYFGLSGDMSLVSSAQVGTSWSIDSLPLSYNTAYQWRIDSTNINGTTTGNVWSFTTLSFDPPVASGLNNMVTIRKVIAAAGNKIWIEDI